MPVSCKHSTDINIIIYCDLCSHSKKACDCCFLWGLLTSIVKKQSWVWFLRTRVYKLSLEQTLWQRGEKLTEGKSPELSPGKLHKWDSLKRGCFPPHLQVATSSTKTESAKCPSRGYEGFSEGLGEGFYLVLILPEFKNYTIYSMPVGLCRFEAFPWKDSTVPDLSDSAGIKVAVSWEILLSQNKGRKN